jgi:hypothetical protein
VRSSLTLPFYPYTNQRVKVEKIKGEGGKDPNKVSKAKITYQ